MSEKILAVVDGRNITESHMMQLKQSLGQAAIQYANPEGEERLLNELINQELFYSEAVATGIESTEGFKAELELLKANLMKQFFVRDFLDKVEITDTDIKDHYEAHKADFQKPASVNAKHILVSDEETVKKVLLEIADGKSFEDAATEYSSCPSKERGGDLGYFSKGQMVPEFEQAAFEMKVDEMSPPVQTQFGFHIIKKVDEKPASEQTLEEAMPTIHQQVQVMKQNEAYLTTVEGLKTKYDVEVK